MGLKADEPLLVAGGTGNDEEAMLLDAYAELKKRHPALRLAIVPRKPERFDEVAALIADRGLPMIRRSQRPDGDVSDTPADAVILGDTMGELRLFYAMATCVFVGRSLVPMGGSDMIEAAAMGKATCFGPHTFNFPQADALVASGCKRVADADALVAQIDAWLTDSSLAQRDAAQSQDYVKTQQGASRRNVEMICKVLNRRPAVTPGAIATEKLVAENP